MDLLICRCLRAHQVVEKLGLRTVIIDHHCKHEIVDFSHFRVMCSNSGYFDFYFPLGMK